MDKQIKSKVAKLVSKGKIEDALKILISNDITDALLTLSQYNNLLRRSRLGLVSNENYNLGLSNIVSTTLYHAGISNEETEMSMNDNIKENHSKEDIEETLHGIMAVHRKRDPEVISKAKELLVLFRNWKDEKVTNPLYDPSNKNLQIIRGLVDDLIQWISNRKEESIEDIAKKISDLFGGKIPDYYQLKEAYKLLETKGFNDQYIEKQLESEVLFLNTRIEISEKIEQFILSLLNK